MRDGEETNLCVNSPRLKCGLLIVTTFQREQYGKREKINIAAEKSNKRYLSQKIKVNIGNYKSC